MKKETNKFSKLDLNKKTIAKLNNEQVKEVRGGACFAGTHTIICPCQTCTVVTGGNQ